MAKETGGNNITELVEKYNLSIKEASPQLYELYIHLYMNNGTMASVAVELNYSIGYINKLNNSLVKYLYNYFDKNEEGE